MTSSESDIQLGFPFIPQLESNGTELLPVVLGGGGYFSLVREIMMMMMMMKQLGRGNRREVKYSNIEAEINTKSNTSEKAFSSDMSSLDNFPEESCGSDM